MDTDTLMILCAAERRHVLFEAEGTVLEGILFAWPRHGKWAKVRRGTRHLRIAKERVRVPVGGAAR